MFTLASKIPNDLFGAAFYLSNKYASLFLYGIRNTLIIALTSTVIGIFLGLGVGILKSIHINKDDPLLKKISIRIVKIVTGIYVEVFRGTPMMVQAVFIYYSFLKLFKMFPLMGSYRLTAGIVIVSINTGAYMAEIVRAGIQSLDKGQNEAARSIGMSNFQTMIHIILPQAIKNTFPAIGNEFVVNIKDTSVLNVVGITELFFQSMTVAGSTYAFQEAMFISAIIYLFLTYTTTSILRIIEKKMDMPISGGPTSTSMPILVSHYKTEESHHVD